MSRCNQPCVREARRHGFTLVLVDKARQDKEDKALKRARNLEGNAIWSELKLETRLDSGFETSFVFSLNAVPRRYFIPDLCTCTSSRPQPNLTSDCRFRLRPHCRPQTYRTRTRTSAPMSQPTHSQSHSPRKSQRQRELYRIGPDDPSYPILYIPYLPYSQYIQYLPSSQQHFTLALTDSAITGPPCATSSPYLSHASISLPLTAQRSAAQESN